MSVKEVFLSPPSPPGFPTAMKGYALLLESKDTHIPNIIVYTERYASRILPLTNHTHAATTFSTRYVVDSDAAFIKHIEWLDSASKERLGMVDCTPRMHEQINLLLDVRPDFKVDEAEYKSKGVEAYTKSVMRFETRFGLEFGMFVNPPYPEIMPTPFAPLPRSPIF